MEWVVHPWKDGPGAISLNRSELHVWKIGLDQPAHQQEQYCDILSADEQDRAERFHYEIHRSRFVAGRALLRILLCSYLKTQPQQLVFDYGLYGKPALISEQNPEQIKFNLSHADALALYAFAIERELGIDIERIQSLPDMDQIAARSFSKREYNTWVALPDSEKAKAFSRCWTRKEAFIKAIGNGLQYPLDEFDVTLSPGQMPELTWVAADPQATDRWSYANLPKIPGYSSALITEGNDCRLTCYQLSF